MVSDHVMITLTLELINFPSKLNLKDYIFFAQQNAPVAKFYFKNNIHFRFK